MNSLKRCGPRAAGARTGHGLAVQPFAVTDAGLDRMTEGMAQIEQGAHAALPFVGGDDFGLVAARTFDGIDQRRRLARQQPVNIFFEPEKKFRIANEPVFNDLGQAGAQFALWQRRQRIGIDDHRLRLVKRADHVLAERMIDPGLAADRRIDLRQQAGRDLHERHAALITGGGEPGHVADHAAAQGDDGGAPVATGREQRIENARQRRQRLMLFAVGQDDLDRRRAGGGFHRGQEQRRDRFIGHDGGTAAGRRRHEFTPGEQARADMDRITTAT
jgi:hypothetical protein